MKAERFEAGLDLWAEIVRIQHEIQATSPGHEIQINDPRMWQGLLDLLDNEHWELLFETMRHVEQYLWFRPHHSRMIQEAEDYYQRNRHRGPRVMDCRARYKQPGWKCCMALREIWEDLV